MPRNKLAGIIRGKGRTSKFYQSHPESKAKKDRYNKKYHSTTKRKKYRAMLQAINRRMGTHGNHDNKDVAHISKRKTVMQHMSKNRGDKKMQFFR